MCPCPPLPPRRALPLVLPEILGQVTRSLMSLEAYVPYTVVQHIRAGRDPHQLPPARVDVIMMACDIVCFTSLSEGCPLSEVCGGAAEHTSQVGLIPR